MVIPSLIILYKLLKRFPQVIVVIYASFLFTTPFHGVETEKEVEVVEYVSQQTQAAYSSEISFEKSKSNGVFAVVLADSKGVVKGYLKSSFHKLYILYSQFLTDRCFLKYLA